MLMRFLDGDGVRRAPVTYSDESSNPCSAPITNSNWPIDSLPATASDDKISWLVARVSDGSMRDVQDLEGTFGEALLRKTDSGSLISEEGDSRRELLPASCGASVLYSDRADDTIAVACRRDGNSLEVLHGGRRIHTGCKIDVEGGSITLRGEYSSPLVTCADAPPQADLGFVSFQRYASVSFVTRHQRFRRPLVSEVGSPWTSRDLSGPPEIHSPEVEVCRSHPVLDLDTGLVEQPNRRHVTLGTTGGLVLGAAGASGERLTAYPIGPLFWVRPIDPSARCSSW